MKKLYSRPKNQQNGRKIPDFSGNSNLMIKRNSMNPIKLLFSLLFLISLVISAPDPIAVYALSAPNLTAPGDGSTITIAEAPPLAIPEFTWEKVEGATSYRIQISSDSGFTTTVVNITTPNTSYIPTSAASFSDKTWYWRVRVESPTPIGDYSSTWSFTKQWATDTNQPSLVSPADGTSVDFYEKPIFSWTPVTGAGKYKLQIYTSPGGWASPTYTATTLSLSHQPINKFANGTYYWRVVPIDAGNHEGTASMEFSFTAAYNLIPEQVEPADGTNPVFTPTFKWKAIKGAQFYRLQYSTDPSFNASVTTIDTRNTTYTPITTLPNDVNYYWRVRTQSGNSISDWSPTFSFIKRWYIKPVLLTPTNNYQHQRFPIFSWTPVPGAAYYKYELSEYPGFSPIYDSGTTANTFFSPTKYKGNHVTFYWRVTPYDGNDKPGITSNTSSYVSYYESVAPHQVYPLYYYSPDARFGKTTTETAYEDRTVGLPIFIWHRIFKPVGDINAGDVYADAYRLEVSTDATFSTLDWFVETENLVAAPTSDDPFTPLANVDYFWRVRPIVGGVQAGEWSQVWKTRIDLAKGMAAPEGDVPLLIRPTEGFEFSDTTPLLQWFPVTGAVTYDVEISQDVDFNSTVDSATVSYPAYAPTQSLAQRSLGDVDFGIYYWRVRVTGDTWSETRRFQISAPSQWQYSRTAGATANRLQIGSDPAADIADNDFDLTDLSVSQSSNFWFFGFHVPAVPTKDVTYALYLDIDHKTDSGANFDARGYNVTTIPGFQPEFAIYVLQQAGLFNATKIYLYQWNGSTWNTVQVLNDVGGTVYQESGFIELQIPNTAIGYQDTTGSYAISLFSLPATTPENPQDSVPSDTSIPGSGPISRFANVTERMNLSMPPNDAGVDPTTYPSILPFFWDWTVKAPWSGANMKAYLDPELTTEVATYTLASDTAYYAQTSHAWSNDYQGDNTYYWRVQPRYRVGGDLYNGAWSQPWRFERAGLVPIKLETSVSNATPTFSWDLVEGAEYYDLQVDDDPGFGSTAINIDTRQNSYTHTSTLANATYYWRVRAYRDGNVINDWTSSHTFTLTLPVPTGLESLGVVNHAPTLCWSHLEVPVDDPILTAWKYRVQVSKDTSFSAIFDTADTEQNCWSPTKGYDDGTYYWRVAMIDGNGKLGGYSDYATFTKQYPLTTLISPENGSKISGAPTFVWEPVQQASKYKLEVSLVENFGTTYDSIITNNTMYTPIKTYTTKGPYYWRVAIIDFDGKMGPFTDYATIEYPEPSPFGKISPVNGASGQPSDITLSWEPSEFATSFEYCYDTTNDSNCTNWTAVGLNTSVNLTGLTPAVYYWQVRAKNSYGTVYANNNAWWSFSNITLITKQFGSIAAKDGWILESGESTNYGGTKNNTATTINIGDNYARKQYRGILSFNTGAGIPDNAVITSVKLKLTLGNVVGGGDPVALLNGFMFDVKKGYFGTSTNLEVIDFQSAATKTIGPKLPALISNTYTVDLTAAAQSINVLSTLSGVTQIRIRFKSDDNNDSIANYLQLLSGENTTGKPTLIVKYYIP